MGNISSIHIKAGHIREFFHNDRTKSTVNSIFKENKVIVDYSSKTALKFYKIDLKIKKERYKKRTKQKLQKKAITLLSAVVNIKSDTNLDDLKKLGKELEKKLGTRIYQIAIHRDEGHIDDAGNKIINEHAHILFSGLDESGKSIRRKLTKSMLRELQDLTAETLDMQRGRSAKETKRKRLDTYDYKEHAKLQSKKLKPLLKENKQLKKENEELTITKKELEKNISNLRQQMIAFNKDKEEKEFTKEDYQYLSKLKKELKANNLKEIYLKFLDFKEDMEQRIKDYEEENKELKDENKELKNKMDINFENLEINKIKESLEKNCTLITENNEYNNQIIDRIKPIEKFVVEENDENSENELEELKNDCECVNKDLDKITEVNYSLIDEIENNLFIKNNRLLELKIMSNSIKNKLDLLNEKLDNIDIKLELLKSYLDNNPNFQEYLEKQKQTKTPVIKSSNKIKM